MGKFCALQEILSRLNQLIQTRGRSDAAHFNGSQHSRQGLSPETRTYNVVMAACNAAGKHAQCLAVFSAMLAAGRAPSTASLNSAISAHCK